MGRALSRLRRATFLMTAGVLELIAAVGVLAAWTVGRLGGAILGRRLGRLSLGTILVVAAFVVPGVLLQLAMSHHGPRTRWIDWLLLVTCLAATAIVLRWAAAGRAVARPRPKPKRLDDFA